MLTNVVFLNWATN